MVRLWRAVWASSVVMLSPLAAGAAPLQPLVIYPPEDTTCVQGEELVRQLREAGTLIPSLLPQSAGPEDSAPRLPLFRVSGDPEHLRIRAWGLSSASLRAPEALGSPDSATDADLTVRADSCSEATQAAAQAITRLVSSAEPAASSPQGEEPLRTFLTGVHRELSGDPDLQASVVTSALGLSLRIEHEGSHCHSETWLQQDGSRMTAGETTANLAAAVRACQGAPQTSEALSGGSSGPSSTGAPGEFRLPRHAGAIVAAMGVVASAVAVGVTDDSGAALVAAALPPVAGGIASYAVPEPLREPVLLSGYWLGAAGGALVAAASDGAQASWFAGGSLATGALTSASLALLNGFSDSEGRLPAWAVALPSSAGAVLGGASLLMGDDVSGHSVEIATLGGLVALLPSAWLLLSPATAPEDRAPQLNVVATGNDARVIWSGSF